MSEKIKYISNSCSNCQEGNRNRKDEVRHPETGGYNYHWDKCPSCQAVINIYGDKTEEFIFCLQF